MLKYFVLLLIFDNLLDNVVIEAQILESIAMISQKVVLEQIESTYPFLLLLNQFFINSNRIAEMTL
jgi:hypothetical protein